jgi:hypothetical protein
LGSERGHVMVVLASWENAKKRTWRLDAMAWTGEDGWREGVFFCVFRWSHALMEKREREK